MGNTEGFRMKASVYRVFVFLFLICSLLFSSQKQKEKDLPPKYQEWLNLTTHIILPEEKDVFLELQNDRDRDLFIASFWRQRDPTPGTPQNEYKEEHLERFGYANAFFRRGTTRDGWRTDMGRIYMILGPPVSIERFDNVMGVYPCQVWSYYGDRSKGFPPNFTMLFYKRNGVGEFRLYNSMNDGPAALIIQKQDLDRFDSLKLYSAIKKLAPTLAGPAVTMIPGRYTFDFRPSLSDNQILVDILDSPRKDVNPTYASHFLNYMGVVSTEYLTNYIESNTDIAIIHSPVLNMNFVHFSINPKLVSIDLFEPRDQYYCNFSLNVSLRKNEVVLFQYSKDYPFYFPPDNIDRIQGSGIAIQDTFPIIEGNYSLNILIQNSVGKEFSVFETEISIPEATGLPRIMGPVLGYELQDSTAYTSVPFKLNDKKLLIDPKDTFSPKENVAFLFNILNSTKELWEKGKIDVQINGLKTQNSIKKSFSIDLKNYPFSTNLGITHSLPADDLSPDYYNLTLILKKDNSEIIDEKTGNFIISPQEAVPHPVTLAKVFPLSNNFLYLYALAYQYDKVDKFDKAEAMYQRAFTAQPNYTAGLIEYGNFLVKIKKFSQSIELIEPIEGDEETKFQYFLIKGMALKGMGNYSMAIDNLLEGNKIYNSNTDLLGSLGYCFYKTGDIKNALDVLKASLKLNPNQEDIKKLIEEIERKENID